MVTENCKFNEAIPVLSHRIRDLIELFGEVQINCILRERNKSADWFPAYSLTQDSFVPIILEVPSRKLQSILFEDISEVCMFKNVHLISFFFSFDFALFSVKKILHIK